MRCAVREMKRRSSNGRPDTLGNIEQVIPVGSSQVAQKLLPTPANHRVAFSQCRLEMFGKLNEHRVSGIVSVLVVDPLKVIHIDHQKPRADIGINGLSSSLLILVVSSEHCNVFDHHFTQVSPIAKSRERVRQGGFPELTGYFVQLSVLDLQQFPHLKQFNEDLYLISKKSGSYKRR